MDLTAVKKVHFIGIGGIGISAIARMMLGEGKVVSGSDQSASEVTHELEKLGVAIFIGQRAENIPKDADLIVYTIAVKDDNPELAEARRLGVPVLSYPEMLGLVTKEKYTIAVAGTHGKTTTTAMIAKIFLDAGLDPTVVVGSLLKDVQSNFIAGKSQYFIAEACEYRRSFLNLNPKVAVITNIDTDHLDYYKNLADIQSAFIELVGKLPSDGLLVCDTKHPNLAPVLSAARCEVVDYTQMTREFTLKVPGAHNVANAQAALAVAAHAGVDFLLAKEALERFAGTWRRFEYKGTTPNGALVYDDYGHHPTEIAATIAGAREAFPDKKLTVVFQPHLYSRTKLLLADFARVLSVADRVIITDIYAAREAADPAISGQLLAERVAGHNPNTIHQADFAAIVDQLKRAAGPDDVIITMGAGNIFTIADDLV